ncbi:hypothetical protein J7438_21485 [Thalassotalea sp. G20_0]|uniref:hypothetical protein n=1 Tax=Thalassotalea sp. G20_0 TaxID=2821093 RepID=UPI001ADC267E|nr:hypothetical protein [Thalassotalea sp. G20_0]MBO9496635.1 hypothetical protein [Thalassotalea sp. G20_0]
MDLSAGKAFATDHTYSKPKTFEDFATKTTSSVEDVLKKARSFGFRDVDIHFGSKKIPPGEEDDQTIYILDGKRFCFTGLTKNTVDQRTPRLVKKFFTPPILREICQPDNIRVEAAYEMIGKAFKYHDFIEESAWKFRPKKEKLLDFLKRNSDGDHFKFLQDISLGMKDGPNISADRNAYYLLALWAELSNAMSPDFHRQDLFKWKDFAVVKCRPDRHKRKPTPEILIPRPRKKLRVKEKTDSSAVNITLSGSGNNHHCLPDNQQKTADTQKPSDIERTSAQHDAERDDGIEQPTSQNNKEPLVEASSCRESHSTFLEINAKDYGPSCSNTDESAVCDSDQSTVYDSDQSTVYDSDESTVYDSDESTDYDSEESIVDDTNEVTRDNTGSQTAQSHSIEKKTREEESESESEITILKVNHLSQQVIKNLERLKQTQTQINRPVVSVSQKRQMMVTLHEGVTLINGLKAIKHK